MNKRLVYSKNQREASMPGTEEGCGNQVSRCDEDRPGHKGPCQPGEILGRVLRWE